MPGRVKRLRFVFLRICRSGVRIAWGAPFFSCRAGSAPRNVILCRDLDPDPGAVDAPGPTAGGDDQIERLFPGGLVDGQRDGLVRPRRQLDPEAGDLLEEARELFHDGAFD